MKREVSKEYGILNDQSQFANRTTFVVDKEGKIQHIVEGGSAWIRIARSKCARA